MTEAVGGMLSEADAWVKEKEMQAIAWASDGDNWSKAADDLWTTTTETDWTQTISDGASATWQGTKDAASWVADNPRKIGTTVGEFIPDAVAVVYSGGTALALTGAKKVGKEIAEEVVEKVVKEGLEEAGEKTAKAGAKKALKEGVEAVAKKGKDIAKVVTKKISNRLKYLGATPGKASKTGKEVFERMKKEIPPTARVRKLGKKEFKEFWDPDYKKWRDIKYADMGHIDDAVTWWNKTGRKYGAKSKEVRKWMLDSDNYRYEYFSTNRSKGAILRKTTKYLPPLK